MKNGISILAFTDAGERLAHRLSDALHAEASRAGKGGVTLSEWTAAAFSSREALVFIGAAGIAVRAIAPYLQSKASDPAVIVVDETGQFAVPILSGHLGGANALSRRIASILGAAAVITTATDLNGVFAVDLWASRQGMTVLQPERIKRVSSRLLAGEDVDVSCPWQIAGAPPAGVTLGQGRDVIVDYRAHDGDALQLVPRVLTLGVGCRRGVEESALEAVFQRFCRERGVLPESVCGAASIDLKQNEPGLLHFCARHGWRVRFFPAEALASVPGSFSASSFVSQTVGVDNVCERSAVLCSGGVLEEPKFASDGVTFALALVPPRLDWST